MSAHCPNLGVRSLQALCRLLALAALTWLAACSDSPAPPESATA